MDIDERTFDFLDAIIARDMEKAMRIALDIEQGEQLDMFGVLDNEILTS